MDASLAERVAAVRGFTRFYTSVIGVLREGLRRTPYSVTEARVIFELAQRDAMDVADLRRVLNVDAGYLSRILTRFEADGIISRARSASDARRHVCRLTAQGRAAFEMLDRRSADEVAALLGGLHDAEQRELVGAMRRIQRLLHRPREPGPVRIRAPQPGDYGWVVQRHGAVYADEYGWDRTFEALVARIVADFVDRRDPEREAAWIADLDGEPVGSVFCVRRDDRVAQLRILLVEPWARGMGIGTRLVDECVEFARRAGYAELVLWTNDVLVDARRIYERAGFRLTAEEAHRSFSHDLVGQYWALDLTPRRAQ
ncbi:MAG: helix-turn-helix domain-containing GNAT family N-acetyltransferase [Chloroflexota bacterium]|nr:helix-turn-helix domain-containing GNAT family N-acetyltransferase [Chloroflexota bacterium]